MNSLKKNTIQNSQPKIKTQKKTQKNTETKIFGRDGNEMQIIIGVGHFFFLND